MVPSVRKLLKELSPVQQEAVECTEGPVLILAGAGSGKTRVLTHRIIYLLQQKKASHQEILAMTFTNKAAGEMKERVQKYIGITKGMWIGTFHSIFAKILRWEASALGYSHDFVIYDTEDKIKLIKTVMDYLYIPHQPYAPKSIAATISHAKNSLMYPDAYLKKASGPYEEAVSKIYPEYQNHLRKNHAFDFDDLITVPIQLFDNYPEILTKYQSRFRYILVDEYQDTNRAQYEIVHRLAKSHNNLCVVGDDDQSIYGWRGADIQNILDFEKDYPKAQVFRLEQNYRSTQNILKAANSIVEKNTARKAKRLWSEKPPGEKVELFEVADERHESQKVVEKIKEEVFRNKRTFSEFAVLYRTNAQSRALEDGLRRSGMSYIIVGGIRFYERKEIKDVLAYLKLIANPNDSVNLKRIINFPLRGIGSGSMKKLENWANKEGISLFEASGRIDENKEITDRIKKAIKGFYELINKYTELKDKISPNELIHALVDEANLLLMYKEDTSVEGQNRADNIRELLAAVSEYAASADEPSLSGFLEGVSLVSDIDTWDDKANAITLMTLHSAKGLEFPVVFITGLEETLFPVSRCMDETEKLEEERRLFYVGLTRAKEKVNLLYAQTRRLYTTGEYRLPSRFLDELDPEVITKIEIPQAVSNRSTRSEKKRQTEEYFDEHPDYSSFSQEYSDLMPGTWVNHESYGRGKILKVEGMAKKKTVVVHFEDGNKKKFLAQYAKFTVL